MPASTTDGLSSEEEWEDVKENPVVANTEDIQVEVDLPEILQKKNKKKVMEHEMMMIMAKREANKLKKETQTNVHKVHLLGLLSVSIRLNELCSNDEMRALALSTLPQDFSKNQPKFINEQFLKDLHASLISRFRIIDPVHDLKSHGVVRFSDLKEKIMEAFEKHEVKFKLDFVLIFIMVLRSLNVHTRLVNSLQPVTFKVLTEKQIKDQQKKSGAAAPTSSKSKNKRRKKYEPKKRKSSEVIPQLDGPGDSPPPKRITRQRTVQMKQHEKPHIKKTKPIATKATKTKKTIKKIVAKSPEQIKEEPEPSLSDKENNNASRIIRKRRAKVELHKLEDETKIVNKLVDETPVSQNANETNSTNTKRRLRARKSLSKKPAPKLESDDESGDRDFKALSPSSESDSSSSDFEEPKMKIKRNENVVIKSPYFNKNAPPIGIVKRILKNKVKPEEINNEWIEVFIENDHKWITFDPLCCKIDEPCEIESSVTQPMHYVVAIDNEGCLKDVTARYASNWLTSTRKLRIGCVDSDWWKRTLMPYITKNKMQNDEENRQLHSYLMSLPLPTSVQAFKDHPLFALRRHILKYESIYPPDISAIGYVKGEEIFPRSAVHILHTKDKWLQHVRTVLPGEKPYKMVASLWRNMKLKQDNATLSLPLFGRWQTVPYEPPIASEGKVPRNEFGNVDLFQPEMLPIGCVHLRLNNLPKVARKLNIDIAPAIAGFDSHSGYPHPVNDGFVVCEEYRDALVEAWKEEEVRAKARREQRREERIYGNWKFLIRSILVKEKIKKKYKVDTSDNKKGKKMKATPASAWQADKLNEAKEQEKTKVGRDRRKKKTSNDDFPFEVETM